MKLLHETEKVNTHDRFFICGKDPDGSGGGVIATRDTLDGATTLQARAIMQGYTKVRVLTWKELNEEGDL